jgi:hypothetical protein
MHLIINIHTGVKDMGRDLVFVLLILYALWLIPRVI